MDDQRASGHLQQVAVGGGDPIELAVAGGYHRAAVDQAAADDNGGLKNEGRVDVDLNLGIGAVGHRNVLQIEDWNSPRLQSTHVPIAVAPRAAFSSRTRRSSDLPAVPSSRLLLVVVTPSSSLLPVDTTAPPLTRLPPTIMAVSRTRAELMST